MCVVWKVSASFIFARRLLRIWKYGHAVNENLQIYVYKGILAIKNPKKSAAGATFLVFLSVYTHLYGLNSIIPISCCCRRDNRYAKYCQFNSIFDFAHTFFVMELVLETFGLCHHYKNTEDNLHSFVRPQIDGL